MVKTIAITGGKGGTGKSTIATALAVELAKKKKVLLLDADVDCPDDHLLLSVKREKVEEVYQTKPEWDFKKCIKCGKCSTVCRSNAIVFIKEKFPIFVPDLCIGCNACIVSCPVNAISKSKQIIGTIYAGRKHNLDLVTGEMKIGYEESGPIVNAAKEYVSKKEKKYDFILVDTAAGAHCNVIAALLGVDMALAVTEPTPLGAHDLSLILQLAKVLKVPVKIILNKADIGSKKQVNAIAKRFRAKIIAEIPYSKAVLESYSRGKPVRERNIRRIAGALK